MYPPAKSETLNVEKRENGVVYTPSGLAHYMAQKVVNLALNDIPEITNRHQPFKILDPACGEGELLTAAWGALLDKMGGPFFDAKEVLCGVDINKGSVLKTAERIELLNSFSKKTEPNLLAVNALFPQDQRFKIRGWDSIKRLYGAAEGFDILIANPPWGVNRSSYNKGLLNDKFTLNKGQYDSSDLFVELALSLVKPNGYFAFIIPDSFFGFERKDLRKLLLENSEIKFIARLGEKIFPGINRGCVVLICKRTRPVKDNSLACMRLTPEIRKAILNGSQSYIDAEQKLVHNVKQSRFSSNSEYLFDIDTKEEELQILSKFLVAKEVIGKYVTSARGVELSKTGKIYKCSSCDYWSPIPNTIKSKCTHCGAAIDLDRIKVTRIISKKKFRGSKPILVGESVRRYSTSPPLWIAVNSKGINYKNISLYYEPKILVRKTGVGITATIDYSNSLTNQVVYIFKPKSGVKFSVSIEFILAVMNSRAMYYFLLKKYGEAEWRSHPYLTQRQILNLPLPDLSTKKAGLDQKKIVSLLRPYLEKNLIIPKTIDAKIEYLIASMFCLSKRDYNLIYRTINTTQGLIPVRELSAVKTADIFR